MSKIRTASFGVLVFAALIFVLLNNKKQMAAKSVPDLQLTVPVRVATVTTKTLSQPLALVGEIAGENDVTVVAETEGRITRVHVNVGDAVKEGAALFQIDDELKRAAFATAEVNFEKARRDLERYESLRADSTVSESQLENARLSMKAAEAGFVVARRQLSDTNVKSPIAGVVTARPVNVGTRVKVGDVIANVVQIARLKTRIQVAERDVFKIAVGDVVTMTTDVYPDKIIAGTIATISDKSDAAHTFSVEVEFANPADAPLKAGMFARVHLDTKQTAALPAIPRAALTGSLRDPHVYVIENGIAKLRHVVVDDEVDGWLAVRSGLANGDAVVVSGQSNLRNDVAVTTAQ